MKITKLNAIMLIIPMIILSSACTVPVLSVAPTKSISIGEPLNISPTLLQKYKSSFKSPDTQPIYDQAQIALDYLALAQEAQNSGLISLRNQYIDSAMGPLKFMTSYLVNSRVRDKNGIIEFWDTSLQDQALTRVSKLARDQALTLLSIVNFF